MKSTYPSDDFRSDLADSARAGASKFNEGLRTAADAASETAGDIARTVSGETSRAVDELSQRTHEATRSAREAMRGAAGSARELASAAKHRALATGERAQDYVRDEPLKAVLAAAAVGAALASLLMIASRRR